MSASTDALRLISRPRLRLLLGVSTATIEKWTRLGVLPPSIVIGNRHFWRLVDIERFIIERSCAAADSPARAAVRAEPSEEVAA